MSILAAIGTRLTGGYSLSLCYVRGRGIFTPINKTTSTTETLTGALNHETE